MCYFHQVSFTYELSREESSNNRSPFLDRVERERKVKFVKIDSQTVPSVFRIIGIKTIAMVKKLAYRVWASI